MLSTRKHQLGAAKRHTFKNEDEDRWNRRYPRASNRMRRVFWVVHREHSIDHRIFLDLSMSIELVVVGATLWLLSNIGHRESVSVPCPGPLSVSFFCTPTRIRSVKLGSRARTALGGQWPQRFTPEVGSQLDSDSHGWVNQVWSNFSGLSSFYWFLLVFTGFYRVLPSLIWFFGYFMGFYLVLPSFT